MSTTGQSPQATTETGRNGQGLLVSALVGGIVGFVLLFTLNLVPIIGFVLGFFGVGLGGIVAGVLYKGETMDGLKAGAVAGSVAAIPGLLFAGLVLVFFGSVFGLGMVGAAAEAGTGAAAGGVLGFVLLGVLGLVVLAFGVAVNAVVGAVGGLLGVSLAN